VLGRWQKFPGGFFIEDSNLTRNYTQYWQQRFQIWHSLHPEYVPNNNWGKCSIGHVPLVTILSLLPLQHDMACNQQWICSTGALFVHCVFILP